LFVKNEIHVISTFLEHRASGKNEQPTQLPQRGAPRGTGPNAAASA